MRRLFGSRGSGGRQDALIPEKAVEPAESSEDEDACVAYEKAKKHGANKKKKDGSPKRSGG